MTTRGFFGAIAAVVLCACGSDHSVRSNALGGCWTAEITGAAPVTGGSGTFDLRVPTGTAVLGGSFSFSVRSQDGNVRAENFYSGSLDGSVSGNGDFAATLAPIGRTLLTLTGSIAPSTDAIAGSITGDRDPPVAFTGKRCI